EERRRSRDDEDREDAPRPRGVRHRLRRPQREGRQARHVVGQRVRHGGLQDPQLRIAQIASIAFSVPPKSHGGTEIAIDLLTRGLVARGHDVTLFASGDSRTTAKLHAVVPIASQDDPGSTSYLEREMDVRNAAEAYARAPDFDLFHAHWPTPAAYFSDRT